MDEASPTWNPNPYPYPILESSSIQSLDHQPNHDEGEANKAKDKQKPLLKTTKKKKKEEDEDEEDVRRAKRGMCRSDEAKSSAEVVCMGSKRKGVGDEEEEGRRKKRGTELGQHTHLILLNLSDHQRQHQQPPPPFHDFL